MKISIACDHGGLNLKNSLIEHLKEKNVEVKDYGCYNFESVHYPYYAEKVAKDIQSKDADFGVLVCTSGIGMAISANKFKGVRAAVVREIREAHLCREHNHANVICFGEGFTSSEVANDCLDEFLTTEEASGRHDIRVNMIKEQEERNE